MDTSGWIPISLIASFNRIKNLTSDITIVVECMRMTPLLEVSPKDRFVRLAQTWPQWVLPNAQTNEDVKKDFEEAASNPVESKTGEVEPSASAEKPTAQQEEPASQSNEDKQAASAEAPASQTNGDVAEAETQTPQEASGPASEEQNESTVKASPPPRRGSPPGEPSFLACRVALSLTILASAAAPHAISPKASLAQPVLDVAVSAVVTVSAPPKPST